MNILHIMENYKPTIGGSVVRNGNMIDAYHSRFPMDKIYLVNLEGNLYEAESDENGIRIYRTKNIKEQICIAYKLIRKEKIDIIHTHNFRFLFVGFLARGLKKIRIVNEIHALYRMSSLKECISYCLLRRTSKIIVLAESAKEYLVENRRISRNKITVIRNGVTRIEEQEEDVQEEGELYQTVKRIKEQGFVIASYNGSFIEWQGVRILADQMDYLLKTDGKLFLLMFGDGTEYEYVENKALNCRYKERVLVHAGVQKDEMRRLYELIDIVLIPRIKSLKTDTAVPLKVIEAMQFSKCVLASGDKGIKEILNQNNAIIYEPGNMEDFRGKLKALVITESLRMKLGEKAKQDSVKLLVTWEENSEKVNALYKSR